jgi:deoxyribose-phosphate aldolase
MIVLPDELARHVAAARAAAIPPNAIPSGAAARVLPLLDLTSLNDDDTPERIEALCDKAVTSAGRVAAVCIHLPFVGLASRRLAGTGVRVATVVDFPGGSGDPGRIAAETAEAVASGAGEIDMVIPWRALAAGDRAAVRASLAACRSACAGRVMKAILETGGLDDAGLISAACEEALAGGADFLKTSTGKLQPAATPEAAALMLSAIRGSGASVGFKAAGGIRDLASAVVYLDLADRIMGPGWASPGTFRFGASGLLDALLAELGNGAPPSPGSRSGY